MQQHTQTQRPPLHIIINSLPANIQCTLPIPSVKSHQSLSELSELSYRLHNQTWPTTQSESHITPTGRAGRNGPPPTKVSFKRSDMPSKLTQEKTGGEVQRHTLWRTSKAVPLDLPGETAWLSPQGDSCKAENACWTLYIWRSLWHTRMHVRTT